MGMCSVSRLPALAEMGSGITAHAQREVHTKLAVNGRRMGLGEVLFPIIGYYFIALWALLGLLKVLFTILRNPFTALKKTTRESEANLYFHSNTLFFCVVLLSLVPPACLLDPSLGSHEYVTANGLKFHCVCAGDTSKPLMLLLHGFPEVTTLTPSHTHTLTLSIILPL